MAVPSCGITADCAWASSGWEVDRYEGRMEARGGGGDRGDEDVEA